MSVSVDLYKLSKKKRLSFDSFIDLHGMIAVDARKKVKEFIKCSFLQKKRNVVIVTGKGVNNRGRLKTETPKWLRENDTSKYIIGFTKMPQSSGGEGALFVKIRNLEKYSIDD